MTNETIRPGDLVMVVRPTVCCWNSSAVGKIFTVREISEGMGICVWCLHKANKKQAHTGNGNTAYILSRLKKINPPSKIETTEQQKEKEMA